MGKLFILIFIVSCGKKHIRTIDIPDADPIVNQFCTVIQEDNSATILCPDGTSAIITNGIDGKDGINGQDGKDGTDGRDGIDGRDGVDGTNGMDGQDGQAGANGIDGLPGADGLDAEPCTVYELNPTTIRIECPDGSFQDIKKK